MRVKSAVIGVLLEQGYLKPRQRRQVQAAGVFGAPGVAWGWWRGVCMNMPAARLGPSSSCHRPVWAPMFALELCDDSRMTHVRHR